jgi:hypothetical protein
MPRLGIGMPLVSTATEAPVLAVQDFFWLNDVSGELTPIHTASRTNLLPYSEDFTSWTQIANITPTPNSTTSPSGENDGTKFLSTSAGAKVRANFSAVSGTTYTFSVYCKNIDATLIKLLGYDGANEFNANLTSEVNTSTWTRISLTFTAANTATGQLQIARDLPSGESAYFWGAQLEQDSRAIAYIPTSGSTVTVTTPLNDTHNAWDYDSANLTLEEDPDSEGSWERLANIVVNGDFTNGTTGWVATGESEINSGSARIYSSSGSNSYITGQSLNPNTDYLLSYDIISNDGGTLKGDGSWPGEIPSTVGHHSFYTKTNASGVVVRIQRSGAHVTDIVITNITVKERAITPLDV